VAGTEKHERPARIVTLPQVLASTIPVAAVALSSSLATRPRIGDWYAGLAKPWLTPPNGVFPVVWTVLFVVMAYAVWRIVSLAQPPAGQRPATVWFFVQLALNGAWSWAFFGLRSPAAGAVTILCLLAAILVTVHLFWRLDRTAALLLVPYSAWVGFAVYLNFGVLRLN
jgi:benzodiazapine receptor